VERHSHGLRKLTVLEGTRGSFQDAVDAIECQTGQRLGKRQVEELAALAALDFEDFYQVRRPPHGKRDDLLVLSADGKGIVMRPDALRTGTSTKAARAGPKPKARLSGVQQDLEHALGSPVGVFVRTASEVRASAESEPFSAHVSKTKIQVLILDSRPTGHARGRLWP
jgi:hypothetical protein